VSSAPFPGGWREVGRILPAIAGVFLTLIVPNLATTQPLARAAPAGDCAPAPLSPQERRLIFEALNGDEDPTEAPEASFSDADLTATLRRYALLQLGLRVEPSKVDRLWALKPPARDVTAELQAARSEGRLSTWLRGLEPPHVGYRSLASARCRYLGITDAGGWTHLPPGPPLKEGDIDPVVEALRIRLNIEGYALALTQPAQRFDSTLAEALRAFQRRHDLQEDGVLGPETRSALNVPVEDRLIQIEANLERWRWLPHDLPGDRLEVDTGAAEATLFIAGRPQLQMRAIVGDPRHRTPMFASRLEAVIFNPPWNVPTSIARNEILPRAARDPGYLPRNHFVRTAHGLQQRPGPKNSLGQLKFDLPSPFGVYLHDTPGRSSFARRVRTLSHGCMRLEKPRELAERLLAAQGWGRAQIDQAIATGTTRRIMLENPTPLFVVYRTAAIDQDGWVHFRPDPYGWDSKLSAALAGAQTRDFAPRPESECSASDRQATPLG
jgi:murein L,D-transpeptidase YcbB/YkuD